MIVVTLVMLWSVMMAIVIFSDDSDHYIQMEAMCDDNDFQVARGEGRVCSLPYAMFKRKEQQRYLRARPTVFFYFYLFPRPPF